MNPSRLSSQRRTSWPWVLTALSLLMLTVRVGLEFGLPGFASQSAGQFGFVPSEVMAALQQRPADWLGAGAGELVTALFVHGDWLHLAGNLAYLWVFGVTVERALGAIGLAASFLLLGAGANLFLAWQTAGSEVPVIGASGGVSAVIGLYLGLFPVSRMGLWIPLGLYFQFARVPAVLVIGSWFTLQFIHTVFGSDGGSVAWWAHVSGFAGGLAVAIALRLIGGGQRFQVQDD